MVNKTKQLGYWQGTFGDNYISRNSDLTLFQKRKPFFTQLLKSHPDITTILEVGSNIGGNLSVFHEISATLLLSAIEPNSKAAKKAQELNPYAKIYNQSIFEFRSKETYDLVFTSGVLIHIANEDISHALHKIYEAARKYILTVEYYSPERQTITYRGLSDALFKRPYEVEWLTLYPELKLLKTGDLTMNEGFDNCRWWLFHK